jgi:hypothetical protein
MPNPQPFEPTYNYGNADIGALSSVVAEGATTVPPQLIDSQVKTMYQAFTSGFPAWTPSLFIDLSNTLSRPAKFYNVYILPPQTYTFSGLENLEIKYGSGLSEKVVFIGKLADFIKQNAAGGYNTTLAGVFSLNGDLYANQPIFIEITNIPAATVFDVTLTAYMLPAGGENTAPAINIARNQTNVYFNSAVSGADLVTQLNAYKAANPTYTVVNEQFTQQGANNYSAFLTVIIA